MSSINAIATRGHTVMFDSLLLHKLLQMKWDSFANKYFLASLAFYAVDICFWTGLVYYCRYGANPSAPPIPSSPLHNTGTPPYIVNPPVVGEMCDYMGGVI